MDSEQPVIDEQERTTESVPEEVVGLDSVTQGQPIKELIGLRNGKLDLSQFDQLIQQVVSKSAQQSNVPAHKLVKVIQYGKVKWTTAAQAREQIQYHREQAESKNSDEVASAIEKAMHGDVNSLEDELLILLCVAHTGFGDDVDVVKKFERRHEEIVNISSEIRDTEKDLERRKRDSVIINDFEEKMGLMMQASHTGDGESAKSLAEELRQMKAKYVLYSRSLMPILSSIHVLRTELIHTKEKLLSNMINQLEQREQGISMNIELLAKNIDKVEATFDQLRKQEEPVDPEMVIELNSRLGKLKTVMEESGNKLGLISCEKEALQIELKNTQEVVREMDKSIDEDKTDDLIKKAQGPKIDTNKSALSLEAKKVSRMSRAGD